MAIMEYERLQRIVKSNPKCRNIVLNLEPTILANKFKLTLTEATVLHNEAEKGDD